MLIKQEAWYEFTYARASDCHIVLFIVKVEVKGFYASFTPVMIVLGIKSLWRISARWHHWLHS
jgi:hypothetical protein